MPWKRRAATSLVAIQIRVRAEVNATVRRFAKARFTFTLAPLPLNQGGAAGRPKRPAEPQASHRRSFGSPRTARPTLYGLDSMAVHPGQSLLLRRAPEFRQPRMPERVLPNCC